MDDFISFARRVDRDYAESNCMFMFKANFEIVENADSLPKSEVDYRPDEKFSVRVGQRISQMFFFF